VSPELNHSLQQQDAPEGVLCFRQYLAMGWECYCSFPFLFFAADCTTNEAPAEETVAPEGPLRLSLSIRMFTFFPFCIVFTELVVSPPAAVVRVLDIATTMSLSRREDVLQLLDGHLLPACRRAVSEFFTEVGRLEERCETLRQERDALSALVSEQETRCQAQYQYSALLLQQIFDLQQRLSALVPQGTDESPQP